MRLPLRMEWPCGRSGVVVMMPVIAGQWGRYACVQPFGYVFDTCLLCGKWVYSY